MTTVIKTFTAEFVGGIGSNGHTKKSLVEVRIVSLPDNKGTIAEYRYKGKFQLSRLIGGGWEKGIVNLDNENKYPFTVIDQFQGGEQSVPIRQYKFSLMLEPYIETKHSSSMWTRLKQALRENLRLKEEVASLSKKLHDIDFADRYDKAELEKAEKFKRVRGNIMGSDFGQIGFGMQ